MAAASAASAAAALPLPPTPIDYIFVPSFNEWIAGASPISEPNLFFTTLGALPSDSARYSQFTDAFLQGHSRTIEPGAREGEGGRAYLTLASCTRVHRLQSALHGWGKWRATSPSLPPCAVLGEECCTVRPDETLTLVYSLSSPGWVNGSNSSGGGGGVPVVVDSIATGNASLVAEKVGVEGWKEVCNPMYNPLNGGTTLACADKSMLWRVPKSPPSALDPAFDVVRGPFLLFSPPPPGAPSYPPVEGARVLVRCAVGGGEQQHFLAVAASALPAATTLACGQVVVGGGVEEVVGWVAGVRVGGWASALTRCFAQGQGGYWYHTERMGPMGGCAEGDDVQEVLGFVI